MKQQERAQLQGEQQFLRHEIADMPESAWITRISLEARLRDVEEQLALSQEASSEPARVRLTFRGRPVVGSRGVYAEFGAAATRAFVDCVATAAAAQAGPLSPTGPVPDREQHQLLITGTSPGSFGFELEEADDQRIEDESPIALALSQVQSLLQSTLGTDDELADAAAGIDPRAIASARAFLETLAQNEAVCAFDYRGKAIGFPDVSTVRRSLDRLKQDNLREAERWLNGFFEGVLPNRRWFEFRLADTGTIVGGKIAAGAGDVAGINQHLGQPTQIHVMETRVGTGRPRYLLIGLHEWEKSRQNSASNGSH